MTPARLENQKLLFTLFEAALEQVNGESAVARELTEHPIEVEEVYVLATGKAASAMFAGAKKRLGHKIKSALVVSKDAHCEQLVEDNFTCIEAGHPIPDERSLEAGQRVIEFVKNIPAKALLLVLTSGGTSALVEALPDAVHLSDWVKLNEWLLASGLDIQTMNAIRQSVSLIKGGRLCSYISSKHIKHLIISDVAGDNLAAIGSGMLVTPLTNTEQASVKLPQWIIRMQEAAGLLTKETHPNNNISHRIIANNMMACKAASEAVKKTNRKNLKTFIHSFLAGDAEEEAQRIAIFLIKEAEAGVHIWGGETTVVLPSSPGQGGRNQHFALCAAQVLEGNDHITLLAVGTDGTDGVTSDAGAYVDGRTIEAGTMVGMDSQIYIKNANAGAYLEETGNLVNTGSTGTNVMDMVIAIKDDNCNSE